MLSSNTVEDNEGKMIIRCGTTEIHEFNTGFWIMVTMDQKTGFFRRHTILKKNIRPEYNPLPHVHSGPINTEVRQGCQGTNQSFQVDLFHTAVQLNKLDSLTIYLPYQKRSNLSHAIKMGMRIEPRLVILNPAKKLSNALINAARAVL